MLIMKSGKELWVLLGILVAMANYEAAAGLAGSHYKAEAEPVWHPQSYLRTAFVSWLDVISDTYEEP